VDGYCDVCGNPPDAAPPADVLGTSQSTLTRSSQALGSTALGSARVARGGTARRRSASALHAARTRIGAGLTTVPPAPPVDPAGAIMKNPVVPENKRNCPSCGQPVGRGRDGEPGRTKGFCPNCQNPYSFDPKLAPGDVIAGQYEVAGPLAHGGMGWIYLARDKNVSDRWVVLKGLLNVGDADATAAAIAEQQYLAQVEHPLIVEIYNFVTHEGAGYIVMEYVGGRSLKDLLKERMAANGGSYDALPVDWALAFIIEILPAFSYLHDQGLIYCDFKPDNVIQVADSLKLIDLGGVRRADDETSAIYGTVGYQAPEVATRGVSVASDIYAIGRTLLVLCAEFKGYQGSYAFSLPPVSEMPLFSEHDSLYRLILKCCAPDPADRFQSAEELRVQLLGILREVVGAKTPGTAFTSASSLLFEPPTVSSDTFDWHQLPSLRPDTSDPQWGWLSNVDIEDPVERLSVLNAAPDESAEVGLAKARTALDIGAGKIVVDAVNAMLAKDPWEWRAVWMAGIAALMAGDWKSAQSSFNAVYGQVPGELAPKLALAIACEQGGELDLAEALYAICASTDANYVTPAGFGLARIRASRSDLKGALAALDLVPSTSRGYNESRRLRAQHLLAMGTSLQDLSAALDTVASARIDPEGYQRYSIAIYTRALADIVKNGPQQQVMLGGQRANENGVRTKLVQAYRDLAKLVQDPAERANLIELANATRKWSLL